MEPVIDHEMPCKGYQQLTVSSTAVGFTVPAGATHAHVSVEDDAVRWRADGTNPTASVGTQITTGSAERFAGNLSAIKFIRVTGDAELNIHYFGVR